MLVQGDAHNVKLGGYYEADFLSAAATSNDNQSNSYTLRQRQFWAQAAFNSGFTLTGGQMWSLVTQTAKGLDNRTEVLPETIDAQYSVGFSWARQYGMRFVQDFSNKVWLGFSVEEPQTTFKVGGTTAPFLVGAAGNSGGLYNPGANYSFNMTPDFIVESCIRARIRSLRGLWYRQHVPRPHLPDGRGTVQRQDRWGRRRRECLVPV